MQLASLGSSRKVVFFIAKFTREDLRVLKDLLETGRVKPFVERTYPLTQVAEAMRYMGTGHVQGKLVLTVR
jgi:NADPH:quinone reductase-like Zn-dependent oxidoreductase